MNLFVNKLHISKSYESNGPNVPESPMNAHVYSRKIHSGFMSPKPVDSRETAAIQKKPLIEPDYFKWCNCHIYLSYYGVYPNKCFKDCNVCPSKAHLLETKTEYIERVFEARRRNGLISIDYDINLVKISVYIFLFCTTSIRISVTLFN